MAKSNKFGTFSGVFTPSILTILGVIMYLRLPFIVGQAGLIATIGIIVIAHLISLSTGLSVSSIATDKKVQAGGTYYMISRSLGLPIGGTLGLALFVGLSFSVSLYLIGFSETFLNVIGYEATKTNIQITGTIILLVVTIITFISTSLAIKTQFIIMALIFLSLVSIFIGKDHGFNPSGNFLFPLDKKVDLLVLFGIFFPAVTGFEAGVSMSGDLKDPKKSIPTGSISAILMGFLVYIGLAVFFSYTVSRDKLVEQNVLSDISFYAPLITAGIFGATLSSALGSILGAPRILQATAVDRISPKFFAKGVGDSNEPRNALLLTFLIAEGGILIGSLDAIAAIVSIFFITTYGFLNLSCAFESWTSADFRPEFKSPIWLSLLGAIACFLVMIYLNLLATLGATVILAIVFLLLKRKELSLQTGDAWSGVWASVVKSGLEKLNTTLIHTRNWRPNILMFSSKENDEYISEVGQSIAGKLGMLTLFKLTTSDNSFLIRSPQNQSLIKKEDKLSYFSHTYQCKNIYEGMDEISRVYGFSGVVPNSILMEWKKPDAQDDKFKHLIRNFEKNDYNSLFLSYNREHGFGNHKKIDLWWSGKGKNLALAINIIRYITSKGPWKDATTRLLVLNDNNALTEKIFRTLERIISQYRVNMEIRIVSKKLKTLHYYQTIQQESTEADLTIVGLLEKNYRDIDKTYQEVSNLVDSHKSLLLINASSAFEEYDLGLEDAPVISESIISPDLPALNSFTFPVVGEDISKADSLALDMINRLNEIAFTPCFNEWSKAVIELQSLNVSLKENLDEVISMEEGYRKNKNLLKLRNDLYFRSGKIFKQLNTETLSSIKESMDDGLSWYVTTIDNILATYPKKLILEHPLEDFAINKKDIASLRWFKTRKKILHPFAKKHIPVKVPYRDYARVYLRNKSHAILQVVLNEFQIFSLSYISRIKIVLDSIDRYLEQAWKMNLDKSKNTDMIQNLYTETIGLFGELEKEPEVIKKQLLFKLQSNARKEMNAFGADLEKINSYAVSKRRKRSDKQFHKIKNNLLRFADQWYDKAVILAQKAETDASILSFKNRLFREMNDFEAEIQTQYYNKIIKSLDSLKKNVRKIEKGEAGISELKLNFAPENALKVFDNFENYCQQVLNHTDTLSEDAEIYAGKDLEREISSTEPFELINAPVAKIIRHFMDSRFISPIMAVLETSQDNTHRLFHELSDQLSLARFNIENIETIDSVESRDEIYRSNIEGIDAKAKEFSLIREKIIDEINRGLEESFEPLSSLKIVETAKVFNQSVRGYKSKRLFFTIGDKIDELRNIVTENIARILYSRSEGLLIARKLVETDSLKSRNEKILDLVERVSPRNEVMHQIPHFYKSLFSGRSYISEDFWIERKHEESTFEKAIDRYRSGIKGGIIVTGDRNSGKTTLCSHVLKKSFDAGKLFHIFPPQAGSVSVEDFNQALQKTVRIYGSIDDILTALPYGSALVINDLELWWERSPEGLETVRKIIDLIEKYSDTCLFVINVNVYTYDLLNKILNLQNYIISTVQCRPFDAIQLRELIIKRHQSSGFGFVLDNKRESQLSKIKLARLFSKYFEFTKGNPGVTLNAWLSNIERFKNSQIYIKEPDNYEADILKELDEDPMFLLQQLTLHKRMDKEKIRRVFSKDISQALKIINPLKLSGLIIEKTEDLYIMNPYVEPYIVRTLKQKGLL